MRYNIEFFILTSEVMLRCCEMGKARKGLLVLHVCNFLKKILLIDKRGNTRGEGLRGKQVSC